MFEFIWFSKDAWIKRKARKHLLAQALSKKPAVDRVIFLEPFTNPIELINLISSESISDDDFARWKRALLFKTVKLSDKFYLHSPLSPIPLKRFRKIYDLNCLLSSIFIKSIAKSRSAKRVVWFYNPYDFLLLRLFPKSTILVFDWTEDWAEYHVELSPKQRRQMKELEIKMVKNVDLVFTVSDSLLKVARQYNPNSHRIPNATAFAEISNNQNIEIAGEMRIQRPILGYIGAICERTDFKLLNRLADEFPKCSIVLIGSMSQGITESDISHLTSKNNVYYLGLKEHGELPKYIKSFDVCLMPYKLENTKTINPTKLYDYLATGKPIVSTFFDDIEYYQDLVRIAETHEEFIGQVREALAENDSALVQRRIDYAKQNSWSARADEILGVLNEYLENSSVLIQ
ncbi:TPA: glycosyltransferase family 1 protein [Candidatus Poribacteria bacterium]|nr:glycosyltransferase family 1 protein [Candidatus Poribacteria bacterium]